MSRFLGYVFLLLALAALGFDVWRGPLNEVPLEFTSTAMFWSDVHRPSLIGLNSFIEKSLTPDLWDLFVLPLISWPAFILAGVVGFVCLTFSKRRVSKSDMMFPRGRR